MISRGNNRGKVTLRVQNGVFWVKLELDPRGEDLVACFSEARSSGMLAGPMPTVVDMLTYNGSIDWSAITAIRAMIPWEKQHHAQIGFRRIVMARCAYVSVDPLLAPIIKIICDLFGRMRHRQFRDPAHALLWVLQSELPPPERVTPNDD